jgi:hypothetical protein
MDTEFYYKMSKPQILAYPSNYAWNSVLRYVQFTQEEILSVKEWIEIRELIKFQKCVTRNFLRDHFQNEIDMSLDIDWHDVVKYVVQ